MGAWLGPRWNEAIGIRRCDINPMRAARAQEPDEAFAPVIPNVQYRIKPTIT